MSRTERHILVRMQSKVTKPLTFRFTAPKNGEQDLGEPKIRDYEPEPSKDFQKQVEKGEKGEKEVFGFFATHGYRFFQFKHPSELTEKTLPLEIRSFFKQAPYLRFDAVVQGPDGEVFFCDVKYKSKSTFLVNESDYVAYWRLTFVIPVYIYFYVESEDKIYRHKVVRYKRFKRRRMWNGNVVYEIPRDLVEPVMSRETVKEQG